MELPTYKLLETEAIPVISRVAKGFVVPMPTFPFVRVIMVEGAVFTAPVPNEMVPPPPLVGFIIIP